MHELPKVQFNYMTHEDDWLEIVRECGYVEADLRDRRYDQVVLLSSAARGAESFYGTSLYHFI